MKAELGHAPPPQRLTVTMTTLEAERLYDQLRLITGGSVQADTPVQHLLAALFHALKLQPEAK